MEKFELFIELLLELLGLKRLNVGYKGISPRNRAAVCSRTLYVCLHEWGGYAPVRHKHINNTIRDWECGMKYQLERFGGHKEGVNLTVTISDAHLCRYIDQIVKCCDHLIPTTNEGMDFAGYAAFYERLKGSGNRYILLTNSSVNSFQCDFIESYIDYMEHNQDVGMLGISCCSKCYQSLIFNNFTPHLQSFFLLTTLAVLEEIVALNGNRFPGIGIRNKQLLIRHGEIRISQLALQLGYKLAVVTEEGVKKFDNNPENWTLPMGDLRAYTDRPNSINPIR